MDSSSTSIVKSSPEGPPPHSPTCAFWPTVMTWVRVLSVHPCLLRFAYLPKWATGCAPFLRDEPDNSTHEKGQVKRQMLQMQNLRLDEMFQQNYAGQATGRKMRRMGTRWCIGSVPGKAQSLTLAPHWRILRASIWLKGKRIGGAGRNRTDA